MFPGFLRIFIFVLLGYIVYKTILDPLLKSFQKIQHKPKKRQNKEDKKPQIESLQACPSCQTYNPISDTIKDGKNYFCNEKCQKDFNSGNKI